MVKCQFMEYSSQKQKKLPPIEKLAEAFSVIADGRIEEKNENTYIVISSNKEKQYKVIVKDDYYRSDDSATKFARYAGYPVLAVLMYKGLLPIPSEHLEIFKDIDWNAINKRFKRDYAQAVKFALTEKGLSESEIDYIMITIKACFDKFVSLDIRV